MALSFQAVQKAYEVLNELKATVLPELEIYSWPEDMAKMSDEEKINPAINTLYGYEKKQDGGWENLVFFTRYPSDELIKKFKALKCTVPNSSVSEPYTKNKTFWIFGWF